MSEATAGFPDSSETLEVSPTDLRELLAQRERGETSFLLLDCREEDEHAFCRIAGDVLVPLSSFVERSEKLLARNDDSPVVVYCHHGMRSAQAAMYLRSRGHRQAFSLAGGIELWSREVDPSVPRY